MKNLKKLLAVIVAICVLATFTVPAFAEETVKTAAEICEDLKVLKGTTGVVDAEYLAKGTQRYQAAIITLRLAGKEVEALAFEGTENFDDAAELEYTAGRAALAYLKANPELGWAGSTSGKFFPYGEASAQQIYKVLLESLGYKQDVDFTWGETVEFAAEKGLVKVADVAKLTNNDLAIAIVEALKAKVKDSEKTLAETLVEAGAINKAAAIEADLYAGEIAITGFKPVGASKLEVSFNISAPADTVVVIKRGTITVTPKTTTWNTDRTTVTFETANKLVAADYTVSVGELSEKCTVQAEKLSEIKLAGDKAKATSIGATTARVGYTALNQYGEDITDSAMANSINWTSAPTSTALDNNDGILEITNTGSAWVEDTSKVVVTGVDPTTGVLVNATLTIASAPKLQTLTLNGVKNIDADAKDQVINKGDAGADYFWVIDFTAVDQYGDAVTSLDYFKGVDTTLNTADDPVKLNEAAGGSSVAWAVDPNDATKAVIQITLAGTAEETITVTAVDVTSGANSAFTFKIAKALGVDSFNMSLPTDIIAAKAGVSVPFTVLDQDGNAATNAMVAGTDELLNTADDPVQFTVPSGDAIAFNEDPITKELKLTYTPGSDGTRVVYATVNSSKIVQLTFTVVEEAVPTTVASISADAVLKLTNGAVTSLDVDSFIVKDQYDRAIDLGTYSTVAYTIVITEDDGTDTDVALGGTAIQAASGAYTLTGTATAGAKAFKATIQAGGVDVAGSSMSFTSETIAKSAIKEYKIAEIGTLFATTNAANPANVAADYAKDVTVYGYTADGSKVKLAAADIQAVNTVGNIAYAAGKVTGSDVDTTGTDETATVLVAINGASGVVTLTQTVTLSDKAPVAAKIDVVADDAWVAAANESFDADTNTLAIDSAAIVAWDTMFAYANRAAASRIDEVYFEVTDQYGVTSQLDPQFYYLSEDDVATSGTYAINNTTGAITVTGANVADGDTFTITAVAKNGLAASLKVIVK